MEDFFAIKDEIIQLFYDYTHDESLRIKLERFFMRLLSDQEGDFKKGTLEKKADRQLLSSIGIDLKSKAVPIEHYIKIFKKIEVDDQEVLARLLFSITIDEEDLVYRLTEKKTTNQYNVFVCPIKNFNFYIDERELGLNGIDQDLFFNDKRINSKHRYTLKPSKLNKKGNFGHFWITTIEDIDKFLGEENPVHIIVDQLGLSHFNFDDNDFRYYFYVHLNGLSFETFKPNATIVDWSKPTVGYISFNDQEAGRTFSITGNKNYIGFVERVFQVLEIDEEKAQKASVMFLKNAIIPPMEISCISMEEEALKRFI